MKRYLLEIYWMLTRLYLKFRGAEVGKSVKCNGFPHIKIKKGGRLIIGDQVQINASRWANAHVIAGSTNLYVASGAVLKIGTRSGLSGSRIIAMESIIVGNDCRIGAGCLICDSDMHEVPLLSDRPIQNKPIIIGDRVFMGAQSIVLKGVVIGDGVVIGAGAVVSRSLTSDQVAIGNPAKGRSFTSKEG